MTAKAKTQPLVAGEPATDAAEPALAATLAERLLAAQRAMPDVEKTGRNPRFQYAYLEDKELTAAARRALQHAGLVVLQAPEEIKQDILPGRSDDEGRSAGRVRSVVKWRFTILAPGTQESRDMQWTSEALDSGDKGLSKSATMARKDFLRILLMVPGGAENEADEAGDELPAAKTPSALPARGAPAPGGAVVPVAFRPREPLTPQQRQALERRGFSENPVEPGTLIARLSPAQATKEKEALATFGDVRTGDQEGP